MICDHAPVRTEHARVSGGTSRRHTGALAGSRCVLGAVPTKRQGLSGVIRGRASRLCSSDSSGHWKKSYIGQARRCWGSRGGASLGFINRAPSHLRGRIFRLRNHTWSEPRPPCARSRASHKNVQNGSIGINEGLMTGGHVRGRVGCYSSRGTFNHRAHRGSRPGAVVSKKAEHAWRKAAPPLPTSRAPWTLTMYLSIAVRRAVG